MSNTHDNYNFKVEIHVELNMTHLIDNYKISEISSQCNIRGGHILTEPIQTDLLNRFGSVSLVKTLVSVYWIANRHHSVWKDSKPIQSRNII